MSDSLRPHESQHTRPPCPSLSPWVCSDSHPSSQWCHPTISSSVIPFSSCLQSFPASWYFNESVLRIRWPKYWSFSFNISPSNNHSGCPLGLTGLISLQFKGLSRVFSNHHNSKASALQLSSFFMVQLSHPYMTTRKTIALTIRTFVSKVMSLLFNILSRFGIAFLPRSKPF